MKIKHWLKKEKKTFSWLAKQLGVTHGRVSQALNSDQIPCSWLPAILKITNREVDIHDEWRIYWDKGPSCRRQKNNGD